MNRKLNIGLSLAAGLIGGILSHYIAPQQVMAQSVAAPQKEISAQSFILVDDKGFPSGVFGFDKDGNPSITLFDKSGKVIWRENGKANPHSIAANLSR
jgi:hypothetical protein